MGDLGVDREHPMLMHSHWLLLDDRNNQPIYACYFFKCLLMNEVMKKYIDKNHKVQIPRGLVYNWRFMNSNLKGIHMKRSKHKCWESKHNKIIRSLRRPSISAMIVHHTETGAFQVWWTIIMIPKCLDRIFSYHGS